MPVGVTGYAPFVAPEPSPRTPDVPGWVLVSSVASSVLLFGGWITAGAVQPSYDPVTQSISALAAHGAHDRWIMTGCFLGIGVCHLITATGLRGVPVGARVALAVAGVAVIGVAFAPNRIGTAVPAHIFWSITGSVVLTMWPALITIRRPDGPWLLDRRHTTAVTILFVAVTLWLTTVSLGGDHLGLAERLACGLQTPWPFVTAAALRAHGRPRTLPSGSRSAATRTPDTPGSRWVW